MSAMLLQRCFVMSAVLLCSVCCVAAQEAGSPAEDLAARQQGLTESYELLEKRLFQLHEYERASNPDRSRLLKQAYDASQGELTVRNLQKSVESLTAEDWKAAIQRQQQTLEDLQKLLALLESEDRGKRIRDEQDRIKQYIAEVDRIMRMQRGIRGQTEGGVDPKRLAKSQEKAAERTKQLGKQIKDDSAPGNDSAPKENTENESQDDERKDAHSTEEPETEDKPRDGSKPKDEAKPGDQDSGESKPADARDKQQTEGDQKNGDQAKPSDGKPSDGKPSDGKPSEGKPSEGKPSEGKPGNQSSGKPGQQSPQQQPENPVQQRIEAAEQRMQDARQELEKAEREKSTQAMEEAERELAEAKKELEEILRQLREEEVERSLTMLESRFRRMLEQEIRILEKTKLYDKTPADDRDSEFEINVGKLGIDQQNVAADADRALLVLREDGSSIAFPETVMQMRDDMQQVASRLNAGRTGEISQEIETDIIDTLNDLVAALAQAQKDQQDQKDQQQPPPGQPPQQPGDQPLVDQIAELKMIRGLQMRINKRHKRYAKLVEQPDDPIGYTDDPDIRNALQRLSGRQEKVQRITRDIVLGKNK